VRDLLVNDLVIFEPSQLTVYPDESIKPEEGQGLNKPATVSLENVFPKSGDRSEIALAKYEQRLLTSNKKHGAQFISYDRERGVWTFKVKHFSKYGLEDDDSEDETPVAQAQTQAQAPVQPQAPAKIVQMSGQTPSRGQNVIGLSESDSSGGEVHHLYPSISEF